MGCSSNGVGGADVSITRCSTERSSSGGTIAAPGKSIATTRSGSPSSIAKPSAALVVRGLSTSEGTTRTSW